MRIDEHILKLLLRHDCIIVPDFGGFVARNLSAKIDWGKSEIRAPRKELIFNRHLQKNDGLLLNSIVENNHLSYEEASAFLQHSLADWNNTIKSGNRIEIEKVGILFQDATGNFVFEQDRFFNLLLSSYGLSDVNFIAVEKEVESKPAIEIATPTQATKKDDEQKQAAPIIHLEHTIAPKKVAEPVSNKPEEKTEVRPIKKQQKHFPWRVAAAAVLIPFGFFAYWIPMQTHVLETGKISVADFNPFRTVKAPQYDAQKLQFESKTYPINKPFKEIQKELSKNVAVFNYKFNEDLYIPIRLHKNSAPKTSTAPYHLIGGCFASEQNAKDFVDLCKSKGLKAFVLDVKGGLNRVSVAQFFSKSDARESQKSIANKNIDTWLLTK